ncbi:MAG: SpoIIE family protein phosphatase, partial [Roseibacillus sp.]|nr:SpoIIE family protein phosphatase [Roseibacillus sp.]
SGRIQRFLGRRREEMPNLFRAVDLIHEDDRDNFIERLQEILQPGADNLLAVEPRIQVAKGEGDWHWFRIRGVVVRDREGQAVRMAGSMIDITPRKLVEQELLEERHLMRLLIDNVPLNIYFKDRDSKFTLVNKSMAKWNGFGKPEDVIGKSDHDLFREDHADEALRDEQQIIDTGEPILGYVEKETTSGGTEAWVLTTKMPLVDRVGEIIGTFGVSSDVSELVRTQQSLAEAAAALQQRNDEIEEELALAREVQQALLPHEYPVVPRGGKNGGLLQFGHRYIPISGLAGDFFEVFPIGDHAAGLFICDVMGHGVRSAIIVSMLRGLAERIHQVAEDPGEFLGQLNSGLSAILLEAEMTMFATAFLAVIDLENGELRYASAGHPAPIMRSEDGTSVLPMGGRGKGAALGLFPEAEYETHTLKLSLIKQLMLFTDGIIEVENREGEAFLQNRLVQAVSEGECLGVDALLDRVLDRVLSFAESQRFDDDVCVLAVEIS